MPKFHKTLFLSTILATLVAGSAIGQDRPAGWQSMPCNPNQFTPVTNPSGTIAYWVNPTCPSSAGGRSVAGVVAPPIQTPDPEDEPEFDPETELGDELAFL